MMIQYSFYQTDPKLSNYIFSYGHVEVDGEKINPLLSPPNGLTGFVIRYENPENAEVNAKDFEGKPIAGQLHYVIGQTTFPIIGEIIGKMKFLLVFFQPLALSEFFNCEMTHLTNKSMDLEKFLANHSGEKLINDLKTSDSIEQQIVILNNFFLKILPQKNNNDGLRKALEMIQTANGNIGITAIETTLKINKRTLERHFNSKIGISPKVYAQIIRFKSAMNYLQANPNTTWVELTYHFGYYDQPHMTKYFKEALNVSPNNILNLDLPFINFLLKH